MFKFSTSAIGKRFTPTPTTFATSSGAVNLVINNAGITIFGTVEESPYRDIEKVMDVDFWGVVHGTKAFLPHLIESGDGHIVNISSVFGLFGVPSQSSYNAAKFAVRGFTESLRQEMLIAGHPVGVTCVHPGGVKTSIVANATSSAGNDLGGVSKLFDEVLTRTSADDAAKTILRGVTSSDARVLIGLDAKLDRPDRPGARPVLPAPVRRRLGPGLVSSLYACLARRDRGASPGAGRLALTSARPGGPVHSCTSPGSSGRRR